MRSNSALTLAGTPPGLELAEGRLALARAVQEGLLSVPLRAKEELLLELVQHAASALNDVLHGSACASQAELDRSRAVVERIQGTERTLAGQEDLEELEALVEDLYRARPARMKRVVRAVRGARRRAVLAALSVLIALAISYWLFAPKNLLEGVPFRTSSTWAECNPKKRLCGGAYLEVFFHTNLENEPWIEYDLGARRKLGRVYVKNRHNYRERAVPLVVEVSNDRKAWREVRRQAEEFREWRASFRPIEARWVRLRVAKHQTALHLEAIELYSR